MKKILTLQNANVVLNNNYMSQTIDQNATTGITTPLGLRSPTPTQLIDPDGKLRRRNSTLGWDENQRSGRKIDRITANDISQQQSY